MSLPWCNFLCLITAVWLFHLVKTEKKKMMNLLGFNLYETLHVKFYQYQDISPQEMVGHLCTNFLSLLQHILFLMPLSGKAWGSLDTVHTWTSLYKNWTYIVQNIRSFFKLGISRFKVDVPSATQCPFHNTILDCHVLSVQNAIIPPVTSSNCYFFDYLIFSIKQEKNKKLGRRRMACQIYRLQFWIL